MGRTMRLLLPKEHGAYAQLGFPLVVGLALGAARLPSVLLALGAVLVFWAHEPLLILAGQRGARLQEELGRSARVLLAVLAAGAAASLLLGVVLMPPPARPWLLLPLGLGAAVLGLVALRQEKTAGGELLAATALASWVVPVAAASSGVALGVAMAAWVGLATGFALSTLAVRLVIRAGKGQASGAARAGVVALSVAAPAALMLLWPPREAGVALVAAVLPFTIFAVVLVADPPHARHLKRIGWGLVAASLAASLALVVGLPRS